MSEVSSRRRRRGGGGVGCEAGRGRPAAERRAGSSWRGGRRYGRIRGGVGRRERMSVRIAWSWGKVSGSRGL